MTTSDDCFAALRRAGWSLGEVQLRLPDGSLLWQIDGAYGENRLLARGSTQAEAWLRACEQARAAGLLGARQTQV